MNITIVLPSLNPDEKLLMVVNALRDKGFDDIVVVNDGSDQEHREPFKIISEFKECHVLTHEVNKGKGRALKTAFSYILDRGKETLGVITVDGDNQHHVDDIYACYEAMVKESDKVILGSRDFSLDNVPFKSKFGNKCTSLVFKLACGINITDTQTGLRAIPYEYLPMLTKLKGERFEYETNMLLEMKAAGVEFEEVTIRTIYIDENATTHFNQLTDSFKIYAVILKFILGSCMSFVIDIGLFTLIGFLLRDKLDDSIRILIATFGARAVSSLFNFAFNRKVVFKSKENIVGTMVKYYILCAVQMLASYGLVFLFVECLHITNLWETIVKLLVDTFLFLISFQIQREWVFKNKK